MSKDIRLGKDTIEKIEAITLTDYDIIDCKIAVDKCIDIIEDLIIEYENLLDEYNNYQTYIEDNYTFKEMR